MRIEAGRLRGRVLPPVRDARPVGGRVRRSLFSILTPRLEGARVADICAGIGALGFEALSRGADHLVMVERDRRAAAALRGAAETWGETARVTVHAADALRVRLPAAGFDLVFLDPPFPLWATDDGLAMLRRAHGWVAEGGLLVAKIPSRYDLPADLEDAVLRETGGGDVRVVLLPANEENAAEGP